ncbi:hypothetical protein B9L23_16790 [Parageobacillus galactosidasius]|uniref:Uncharacterized protein n=1 Tax=Parageobacillus galactosidasius TaxID=883812 RepID=A0A226QJS0_9BACL|nr:hypothetical protein B9L23_16790 [Parageobacillus galactosidasius]
MQSQFIKDLITLPGFRTSLASKRLLDAYSLDSLDNKDDTEKLARYHPFDLESLKELSRPLPDD